MHKYVAILCLHEPNNVESGCWNCFHIHFNWTRHLHRYRKQLKIYKKYSLCGTVILGSFVCFLLLLWFLSPWYSPRSLSSLRSSCETLTPHLRCVMCFSCTKSLLSKYQNTKSQALLVPLSRYMNSFLKKSFLVCYSFCVLYSVIYCWGIIEIFWAGPKDSWMTHEGLIWVIIMLSDIHVVHGELEKSFYKICLNVRPSL